MNENCTISLFGATGASGKEFLKLALKNNYKVKALVIRIFSGVLKNFPQVILFK